MSKYSQDIDFWKQVCCNEDFCGIGGGFALQVENVRNANRGPTKVFCDNEAITKKKIFLESTLKKKHNSIAYHRSREAVVAGTITVTKEGGKTNLADVLTKPLAQATKDFLCD